MKKIIRQFQHIYDEIKDKNEIAIIEKYGDNAKRFSIALTSEIIVC